MLEKTGTCKSCGYENKHCICQSKNQTGTIYNRNTSGQKRIYQNYTNYGADSYQDYARTSKIQRTSPQERKLMEELHPVNGEQLLTFLSRTEIAIDQLTEYSNNQHIYNTTKTWSCHTTSRYCFICVSNQYITVLRSIIDLLPEMIELSQIHIKLHVIPNGIPEISLYLSTLPNQS